MNKNKKGFTLVELLIAVAIIAVLTPALVRGFIYASELNYRSRLQQRADAAANSVYEGIASVDYEELSNYLSTENDWQPITDGTGVGYDYYVSKKFGEIENCEIKVAVQKYSESYVVPDLNFIGVKSKYLTLASEVNNMDSVVTEKIEQYIKSDEEVKKAVIQDVITKIKASSGVALTSSQVDSSRILIDCGEIDKTKISKWVTADLDVIGNRFQVEYKTAYRYPADIPNPDVDTATLKVAYTYSHKINGKWVSVSNDNLDVQESLRSFYLDPAYRFQLIMDASEDVVSVDAEKDSEGAVVEQTMFVYYSPLSKMDWIDIKGKTTGLEHNVFFIEQSSLGNDRLNLDIAVTSPENNFKYSYIEKLTNDYTRVLHGLTAIKLYSNNVSIASNGIPDSIYKSSEGESTMYRVQVSVICESTVVSNVSGEFQAGGGTVGKFKK